MQAGTRNSVGRRVRAFLRDEVGGEKDNINTLLILALVVLPLVMLLIFFRDDITDFVKETWADLFDQAGDNSQFQG